MKNIYNEVGISLVLGEGNWLGCSHEIEDENGEVRKFGLLKVKISEISDMYFRIWIYKRVFILSRKDGFKIQKKKKMALKIIFGWGVEKL